MLLLSPLCVLGLFGVTGTASKGRPERFEIRGQSIFPKYAMGRVLVIKEENDLSSFPCRIGLSDEEVEAKTARLQRVFERVGQALTDIAGITGELSGLEGIFGEMREFLLDHMREQKTNLASAINAFLDTEACIALKNSSDAKFSSIYQDIVRLGLKLLNIYRGNFFDVQEEISKYKRRDIIIAAEDICPSDLAALCGTDSVKGVLRKTGNLMDHNSIGIRNKGCAGMVSLEKGFGNIRSDNYVIIDGHRQFIIVNPTRAEIKKYRALIDKQNQIEKMTAKTRNRPAKTKEEVTIDLYGNVMQEEDLPLLRQKKAVGIGLVRTEAFIAKDRGESRPSPPTKEDQAVYYEDIVYASPGSVTFRTVDVSKDKQLPFVIPLSENNLSDPRKIGIGACLDMSSPYYSIFRDQLAALLGLDFRNKTIKIMFPLVLEPRQLEKAMGMVSDIIGNNPKKKERFAFGIMVEHPETVANLPQFLENPDLQFISVGTNDLTQYSTKVSRYSEEKTANELDPRHLKQLAHIYDHVKTANEKRREREFSEIDLSCCGDMGNTYYGFLTLLAYGIRKISIATPFIDAARFIVQNIVFSDLAILRSRLQDATTPEMARWLIDKFIEEKIEDGSWDGGLKKLFGHLKSGVAT
ncbi:hypothetical protein A2276_04905 [candidate division WOR-1 bacterium RIFOXYA12_FULL_43_27]|uniref:PEP-utilising enzyme C-terminal domain-containing protein n=1 Tax=candidate division WOR-1 bacterium RIFOXYC2_FULL_46_14 TaxID=1802587 RepID=A0A1F4U8D4_UNCSA|nr:MAG: hypothetical protein A2276_04905 [candidate division WOR-1 bacterium RIFOXYA12_FULL_43_27]OGC20006.1 MAG: hypothetical protein A2292_02910 [candidate division WOR-1 bacterium RIFOXYB2_FULL_46_45]OGC32257.1 MAG: hypothetical protein A2232_08535 [candidate division WOR-1 bacterium RIFOXYA2_FULL_46_56]OGC41161.1 MAG: hypothetical protein A2438_07475 [candidate division WOR-1 bacterium RIFOXYC2_FULL_46_14]